MAAQKERPFAVTFTISPATEAKKLGSRTNADGSWRPSSIFGGLWGASASQPIDETGEAEAEADDEEQRTIKGVKSGEIASDEQSEPSATRISRPTPNASSAKARLSSIFTDWIAPEASTSKIIPSAPLSSRSPDATRKFMSLTTAQRNAFDAAAADSELEEDIDQALEALMVQLGWCSYRR